MERRRTIARRALGAGLGLALTVAGCQTDTGTVLDKKTTQGAILGTLGGAAAGAAIDHDKRGRGALIGAAVGGLAGGLIGNYLDRQAQEMDAIPDADVRRNEDSLTVLFPGDVLFDSGSSALAPGAYQRLRSLADTLRRYPDTDVVVKGHTDSTGSESFNLRLSEERAENVRRYLIAEGVSAYRVTSVGFGEAFPLASNATPEGRQQNRRVEIEVRPNDELREEAAQGR
jgi:outer membrane protein OmpA-like peptidoglycan-associated protein